jgi:hypothetical protein
MLFSCYLRDGVVYVPTMARRKSEPIYTTIEPVSVVPMSSPEEVRRALLETVARKNVVVPDPEGFARAALDLEICWREKLVRVLSQRINVEHQRRRWTLQDT